MKIFKESIEKKLARIMSMRKEIGDFSVDLYYNDLAEANQHYVAKFKHYGSNKRPFYARCSNFYNALSGIEIYINTLKQ